MYKHIILFLLLAYFYNMIYTRNIIISYILFAIFVYIAIFQLIKYDKKHNYKRYGTV
jgi:predicted ABC-type exoprotein transport system permease subunit